MKTFWNWLQCRLTKHLRGKPTGEMLPGMMKQYQCPRCLATWTRKVVVKEPK